MPALYHLNLKTLQKISNDCVVHERNIEGTKGKVLKLTVITNVKHKINFHEEGVHE